MVSVQRRFLKSLEAALESSTPIESIQHPSDFKVRKNKPPLQKNIYLWSIITREPFPDAQRPLFSKGLSSKKNNDNHCSTMFLNVRPFPHFQSNFLSRIFWLHKYFSSILCTHVYWFFFLLAYRVCQLNGELSTALFLCRWGCYLVRSFCIDVYNFFYCDNICRTSCWTLPQRSSASRIISSCTPHFARATRKLRNCCTPRKGITLSSNFSQRGIHASSIRIPLSPTWSSLSREFSSILCSFNSSGISVTRILKSIEI